MANSLGGTISLGAPFRMPVLQTEVLEDETREVARDQCHTIVSISPLGHIFPVLFVIVLSG
jgi:hypothetical protein